VKVPVQNVPALYSHEIREKNNWKNSAKIFRFIFPSSFSAEKTLLK
jgi:hypothetical protein